MNDLTDKFKVHVFSETQMFCIEEAIHCHIFLTYYPFDEASTLDREKIHFHESKCMNEKSLAPRMGPPGMGPPVMNFRNQDSVKIQANDHSKIVSTKSSSQIINTYELEL